MAGILTTREQKVLVDGEESRSVKVKYGVPQGTVLGPLMFYYILRDRRFNLQRGGGGYCFFFRSEIFFRTTES